MIRSLWGVHHSDTSVPFADGIQNTASLVLGHNYEQNGNDIKGTYPLGTTSGSPVYANAWSSQGYGITDFGNGSLQYHVSSAINAAFEIGTYTTAMHFRTGSNPDADCYLIGYGSTFDGVYLRRNGATALDWNLSGTTLVYSTALAADTNYHIAITASSGVATDMYLNGSLVATAGAPTITTGGLQYQIGELVPSDWAIYDYGVWNIYMNSTQINNIMNNLVP